jgi:hypothetical protein
MMVVETMAVETIAAAIAAAIVAAIAPRLGKRSRSC